MAKARNLCRQERKELKVLADDFKISDTEEVAKIIETCSNYQEGHRMIMAVYDYVYM